MRRPAYPLTRPILIAAMAVAAAFAACTTPGGSAAPSDQMMEHSATPSDQMMEHSATPSDEMMEHSATPSDEMLEPSSAPS